MLCERCHKKEASVFYEETVNGTSRSLSLCHACADELQKTGEISVDTFFSLPYEGLFGGLFGHTETPKRTEKACPLCGSTLRQFTKDGKMGCPECYRTFKNELQDTVHSIHGSTKHVGRAPKRFQQRQNEKNRLLDLKAQMKAAIDKEDFELAATLRDEIRALEANGKEAQS